VVDRESVYENVQTANYQRTQDLPRGFVLVQGTGRQKALCESGALVASSPESIVMRGLKNTL